MKNTAQMFLVLLAILVPLEASAAGSDDLNLGISTQLISLFNFILLVTSIISIKQVFWPGEHNHTAFQLFNIIFTVIFYAISLRFLVNHKDYFEGYEHLSGWECIKKHFLTPDFFAIIKRLIVVAFVLNIIYIIRHGKDYYSDI
ncbi:MAG: hypothetical protein H7257_15275 [Taibaiella sp.]|nr:hypothetical protein [Taibaiella sp.]